MALDTVRSADDENGVIENLEGALGFRRKIHMSRGIEEYDVQISELHAGLAGKDRDAAVPFDVICIEKCVPMIHAPGLPQRAAEIEHGFRERCFSGVHMGENAYYAVIVHIATPCIGERWLFSNIIPCRGKLSKESVAIMDSAKGKQMIDSFRLIGYNQRVSGGRVLFW